MDIEIILNLSFLFHRIREVTNLNTLFNTITQIKSSLQDIILYTVTSILIFKISSWTMNILVFVQYIQNCITYIVYFETFLSI